MGRDNHQSREIGAEGEDAGEKNRERLEGEEEKKEKAKEKEREITQAEKEDYLGFFFLSFSPSHKEFCTD